MQGSHWKLKQYLLVWRPKNSHLRIPLRSMRAGMNGTKIPSSSYVKEHHECFAIWGRLTSLLKSFFPKSLLWPSRYPRYSLGIAKAKKTMLLWKWLWLIYEPNFVPPVTETIIFLVQVCKCVSWKKNLQITSLDIQKEKRENWIKDQNTEFGKPST